MSNTACSAPRTGAGTDVRSRAPEQRRGCGGDREAQRAPRGAAGVAARCGAWSGPSAGDRFERALGLGFGLVVGFGKCCRVHVMFLTWPDAQMSGIVHLVCLLRAARRPRRRRRGDDRLRSRRRSPAVRRHAELAVVEQRGHREVLRADEHAVVACSGVDDDRLGVDVQRCRIGVGAHRRPRPRASALKALAQSLSRVMHDLDPNTALRGRLQGADHRPVAHLLVFDEQLVPGRSDEGDQGVLRARAPTQVGRRVAGSAAVGPVAGEGRLDGSAVGATAVEHHEVACRRVVAGGEVHAS